MLNQHSPSPQLSWLRFSLRWLLAVIAVGAVAMAWVANELKRARFEQAIIDRVERLGCSASFGRGVNQFTRKTESALVIELDQNITAQTLTALARVLQETQPTYTIAVHYGIGARDGSPDSWTAVDLSPLSKLGNLRRVQYRDPGLTNLDSIAKLTSLEVLLISDTRVTDLRPIASLSQLRLLFVTDLPINDLSPVNKLKNLEVLFIHRTNVSDLSALGELVNLERVMAAETRICDLSPLANLENLNWLILADTPVRDITPLFGLKKLIYLDIRGTQVSKSQIEALQAALPNCKIKSNWSVP